MSLIKRVINTTFQLSPSNGTFPDTGKNTVTISGLRTTVRVIRAGTPQGSNAEVAIYGVQLSIINKLATLGLIYQKSTRNTVTIQAGDAESGMHTVFVGTIQQTWGDFSAQPQVAMRTTSFTAGAEAVIHAEPVSTEGAANAVEVMKSIADKMGLSFENNGVSTKLPPSYFWGPLVSQAAACARAGNFMWFIEDKVLAIWPKGKTRAGDIPLISPETGMKDYPTFTAYGVLVNTIYNPAIKFGSKFKVESSIKPASKTWEVIGVDHDLESEVPHGKWFSTVHGHSTEYPKPAVDL